MSVFARKGNQIVLDVALYPGDAIRILILYGNEDLKLQTGKSLLACHKVKEPHLDWTNWCTVGISEEEIHFDST